MDLLQVSRWPLWSNPDSRLYIDKIFARSSRYANWEPARQIELGDYGMIDRTTGEFHKEGNIFVLESTKEFAKTELSITTGATDHIQEYVSIDTSKANFKLDNEAEVPFLATAALKTRYKFSKRRGAVLVMHCPQPSTLEGDLAKLPSEEIRGKHLVTQVIKCPHYFMFLSQKEAGHVSLVLQVDAPVPAGMQAGSSVGGVWHRSGIQGSYKASQPGQEYTPLFQTKVLKKLTRLRGARPPSTAEEGWVPSAPPWEMLDSNGKEWNGDNNDDDDDDSDSDSEDNDSEDDGGNEKRR
ncbi:hypothetical protein EYR40_010474 [Pleurotus pulmonarius]|nr:hypothetical protein EYR40_010474 [Pleurotus pulmonarius]